MANLKEHPSLTTRLLLPLEALILLTMLAVGGLALHLVESELSRQVEARLAQGASATDALYAARLRETQALVTLVAERPTLQRLVREEARAELPLYLETLRAPTRLDCLLVLDAAGLPFGYAPNLDTCTPLTVPSGDGRASLQVLERADGAAVPALVALAPLRAADGRVLGTIMGWERVDDPFLAELGRGTGLIHALYFGSSRLAVGAATLPPTAPDARGLQRLAGRPFYLQPLPLAPASAPLVDMLALPAQGLVAARQRVLWLLAGSTAGLGVGAALLAYGLGRRITAPLRQLVGASARLGQGDLTTPFPTHDAFREVAVLSHALEQMRHRLHEAHSSLQQANQWHETLLASLAEGVVTVDSSGNLTSFSAGAERILGWRPDEAIGRPFGAVFRRSALPSIPPVPPPRAPGTLVRQMVLTREGVPLTLRITSGAVTPRAAGGSEQAFVVRDVTEEEQAERLRAFLLANVSHEFKTPLAALQATAELLAGELPTLSQGELRELVDSVLQGTLRLTELVDNLLGSASLHTGHFAVHPRPCDLEVVIEEVLLTTRPLLALHHQYLRVDAPSPLPLVEGDARRLAQVFVNLLSNASKHGPARVPILLRVLVGVETLRVEVEDQGPGIPAEVQPHLFQPFARPDGATHGGIGLGLSIVRAIIERHGGRVGLESEPGRGTVVWFTLLRSGE